MTDTELRGSILGTRVRRTEDPRLLTGAGRYVDDLHLPGKLHAVFARSEVAHATLGTVHVDDARDVPGVVAVFTSADLGVAPHHGFVTVHPDFARPPLADGVVRFVGEAIAMVVAETVAAAADGAAAVWADYETLPVLVDPEESLADGAPVVFPEHGSNEAIVDTDAHTVELDGDGVTVVRGRYVNQRMAVVSMEPNACAAVPGPDGELTFYASTQMPHGLVPQLAGALGLERDKIHVIAPQVGGGFGGKAGIGAEYSSVAAAARHLGRPVTWTPTRSDDLVSLPHSRGQVQYAELGVRADGTFSGLRVRLVGDGGAYPGIGSFLPAGTKRMSNGTYRFPAIQFDVAVGVTNTTPMGAYRGAGRPEATALIERLVDHAALVLGIDPIELRRRNLLTDDMFPFTTLTGVTYDTGAYALPLETAAAVVGYDELRREQAARRERGDRVVLGIGVAAYVEITAGGGASEFGAVDIDEGGDAVVRAGTFSHGQGHQTAFAMIVSDQTGIPVERIRLVDGDTRLVPTGGGTGGSRSLQLGGSAVHRATEALVDKARRLAAHLLEADVADIVVDRASATVGVTGVPASALSWAELAQRAAEAPAGLLDGDG
ncbi:MAG: xanthine dehydrogenase family protein molybdopterin-binding subunit, partial [Actinomycetota bacterium]|nr:xanthine dehydrogenase family protein molybdopterin-binding subunit [Actinomycetota bacterium]